MIIRANVVSRVLGQVHVKSETHSSRIRGVNYWTRGYHVETDYNGTVWISFRKFRDIADMENMISALNSTLTLAGYTTEVLGRSIKVTGKK